MTLLKFLPAATPARIVTADLRLFAPDRLDGRIIAADASRPRTVAAHRRGRRSRRRTRRHAGRRRTAAHGQLRWPAWGWLPHGRRRFAPVVDDRPQPPQVPHDVVFDAFLHRLKQREAL